MSRDSERRAWTKFAEERSHKAKRPRPRNRVKERALQAELEALDDLVTEHVSRISGCTDGQR
jgi:hypothetical protein